VPQARSLAPLTFVLRRQRHIRSSAAQGVRRRSFWFVVLFYCLDALAYCLPSRTRHARAAGRVWYVRRATDPLLPLVKSGRGT
jgi:hypothetical protein